MLYDIASDMCGPSAEKDDFSYKNGTKIISQILTDSNEWTEDDITFFIDRLIFHPLGIDFKTRTELLAEAKNLFDEAHQYAKAKTLLK